MDFVYKVAILVMIGASCYVRADEHVRNQWKSEGGFIISWETVSSDTTVNQIGIADEQEHAVVSLNVLAPVADARRVSIYDVSARGNLIAVAAVYESKQGNRKVRPTAALLIFDLNGKLLAVSALEPSYQIALLAVDDNSSIWTLTEHADTNVDPSTVPMVVKYTAKGEVAQELLTRSMFPFHASDMKEDIEIGVSAMGYGAGVVWFWLPGSTDFVTISTSDNKVALAKTQLPKKVGQVITPLSIKGEPSGNLVAQVGETDSQGHHVSAYYKWSRESASWAQFKPGRCKDGRFIGTGDTGQIYILYKAGRPTGICTFHNSD